MTYYYIDDPYVPILSAGCAAADEHRAQGSPQKELRVSGAGLLQSDEVARGSLRRGHRHLKPRCSVFITRICISRRSLSELLYYIFVN